MNRLSDLLHTAVDADGELDLLDLDDLHARAGTRRRRRTQLRLAGGVVGALALVAGLSVAVGAGGDGPGEVRAEAPADPSISEPPPSSEPGTTVAETTVPETTASTSTEPPPTSTSTEPAPTTEPPPTTTAPAPTVVELHGTWEGTGRTGFGDKGCDDLSGTMRRQVTMDDGSVWTSGEDVCASVIDDMWVAEGSFFLTDAAGDTLTGPYVISTPMATPGVPYTITFTEGTGAYADATGQCHVTIDITPPGGLAQTQTGEMTCTITLGAGGGGASDGSVPESV